MKIKYSISLFALLVLIKYSAVSDGGAPYSIIGIGDISNNTSAYYEALGGTSIAMPNDYAIETTNPALWGLIKTTRLQVGYRFAQKHISDTAQGLFQTSSGVDGLMGVFSIDTAKGISVCYGLKNYTNVNYLLTYYPFKEIDGETVSINASYKGYGGITNVFLGGSFRLYDRLFLGSYLYANFGLTTDSTTTFIQNTSYATAKTVRMFHYSGGGFKLGAFYDGIPNFKIGAFYKKDFSVTVDVDTKYIFAAGDTVFTNTVDCPIPDEYGFGISYAFNRLLVGADYRAQDFSNFTFNKTPNTVFKNAQNFSLGFSYIGSKSAGVDYADKVTYNAGLNYRQLYYNVEGKDINEYSLSMGAGLPVVGNTRIDLSMSLGSRGVATQTLTRELFAKFFVNVSMGEIWFQPFKKN